MALIQKSGLGPKVPWREDSGQAVPTMQAAEMNKDYGPVDVTTPLAWLYMLAGYRLRRTVRDRKIIYEREPEPQQRGPTPPPVPPRAAGGTYRGALPAYLRKTPYRVLEDAYSALLGDSLADGDVVLFRDRAGMLGERGSVGYECRHEGENGIEVIELAEDLPLAYAFHALAHERRAKKHFRGRKRFVGDHELEHGAIIDGTDEEAARYVADALRRDAFMRRN